MTKEKKQLKRWMVAIGAASVVSGCAVGPDYVAPEFHLPTFFGSAAPESDAASVKSDIDLTHWWLSFNDPTLSGLIEKGRQANNDLLIAQARLREARALRQGESSELYPGSTVSGSFNSTRLGVAQAPGLPANQRRIDSYEVGFDVLWELDIFGGQRRRIEASSDREEAARARVEDALRSVAAEIARNYFELRGYQRQLQVARENVSNQTETFRITEARHRYGEVTELDSSQANAQMKLTEATVPTLEAQVGASIRRLSVLVGQNPNDLIPELETVAELPHFTGPAELGAPLDLLHRRPDLKATERELAAATAEVGIAIANYYPKVEFNGSISVEAQNFGDLSRPGFETFRFGPSISWTGLNYHRIQTSVNAGYARVDQAAAMYQQSVLLALEETENSLVRFSKEQTRRLILTDAVNASKRALEISRVQYEAGETDLLAVLNSQRDFFQAQNELTRSDTDLLIHLVALYKALGGGWGDQAPTTAHL